MKAAVIHQNGGADQLVLHEVPQPEPRPGEVLIKIRAAALNHLDIWLRMGRPGSNMTFPHILGADAAGEVAAVGAGVTGVQVGQEVIINPGLGCTHCAWCARGEQSECPDFTIVGMKNPGTYAEYVTVPAENVQPKPEHLSWEEAAALPLAYLTAWRMLFTRARLFPGETVLIHGIGGGVALAALQLAHLAGARAIVTSSSEDKLERAKGLGAAHAFSSKDGQALVKAVLDVTSGYGADVAIDSVGAATFPVNLDAIRKGGRIVHCGVTSGPKAEANLSTLYWKQLSVLGSTMGSQEDFRQLLNAVDAAQLKPVMDQVFPLADAGKAQARMEAGKQFGKIALAVG